jgi:hypothetical protein
MVVFKSLMSGRQSEIMTNALDLAKTAAGFASNQTAIEPLIAKTKQISNQSYFGSQLSHADEEALFGIYLQIEKYLMTADPIRAFNKDELRNKASVGLRARLENYEHHLAPLASQLVT